MVGRSRQRFVVCCTPFGERWTWFVQDLTAQDVRWKFFSDERRYRWQGWVKRPNLNTPVAGFRTAWAAWRGKADLIITIGPRFSLWVSLFCWLFYVKADHMVFTFNFPEMPRGLKKSLFRFAFRHLTMMRVHSRMEIQLYHEYFGIPLDRIRLGLWAMNMPEVKSGGPLFPGKYLSAVGGNSRDYAALLRASHLAPEIPMVWVVRPENIAGMDLPPQVTAVCNVEPDVAMNYLAYSMATVLPLVSRETPCGHVTLVAAMYLTRAILVTDSAGIADYVTEGVNGLLCPTGDAEALAAGMRTLWQNPENTQRMGLEGFRFAQSWCTEAIVRQEMYDYLAGLGLARENIADSLPARRVS